mmetsp:Transcript_8748/g.10460  ORF Transcript_8748/g.10460 Transcript_8748/m.10460 type:complete len:783 (+) Transcript_8748:487-2835(+)
MLRAYRGLLSAETISQLRNSVATCSLSNFQLGYGNFISSSYTTMPKGPIPPPIAAQKDHRVLFGQKEGENRGTKPFKNPRFRSDPWFWLRDDERKSEEVMEHLKLENAYGAQQTEHLEGLREVLYKEHISHLKETDDGPSYPSGGKFFYYTRQVKGLSYGLHCRKPILGDERVPSDEAPEEILLDVNKIAEGSEHCDVGCVRVSPDTSMVAYTVDFSGDEVYDLFVIELGQSVNTTAANMKPELEKIVGGIVWGDDSTIFYLSPDATKRPYQVWRHKMGTSKSEDVKIFEENDEQFWVGVHKSRSERFLLVQAGSSETSEAHFVDLEQSVENPLQIVHAREFGLRYDLDHDGYDGFVIWTNKDKAVNNRLMYTPVSSPAISNWEEIIPYDENRKIDNVELFQKFVAIEGRMGGLTRLWLLDVSGGKISPETFRQVEFDEELYEVGTWVNKDFATDFLRIHYSSLTTPTRYMDVNIELEKEGNPDRDTLIKEQQVLNFDRDLYVCKRVFATAPDKTQIPISIVHLKSLYENDPDGETIPKPCYLYGYGSYGVCIDPGFHRMFLPYLDRGMVCCIAHVRGGGEMGQYWYEEQGKYLNKRNTFSDFIACAEHLVDNGVTTPEMLGIEGRSAGGLLMGAVLNMRPDLFKVAVAGVPFVDCMNTMSDPSIPLTTGEWEEWGNPNEYKYFDYMLSYSPYDNVREQDYPNILVTAGLHDPRVAYWEPAKWASKLRLLKTDENEVVCKFDLSSGHFSASDRYKYIKEKAFDQAYVLDKLGLADKESISKL